jgi:alpha-methylacyl-CoA racemase
VSPVLSFDEAASDPHNAERGLYRRVAGVLHPRPAPRFSRTAPREPDTPSASLCDLEQVLASWSATQR